MRSLSYAQLHDKEQNQIWQVVIILDQIQFKAKQSTNDSKDK